MANTVSSVYKGFQVSMKVEDNTLFVRVIYLKDNDRVNDVFFNMKENPEFVEVTFDRLEDFSRIHKNINSLVSLKTNPAEFIALIRKVA